MSIVMDDCIARGVDYHNGLSSDQSEAIGLILRGLDENDADCFPGVSENEATAVAFMSCGEAAFGLGNSPAASPWGSLDHSLPDLQNYALMSCRESPAKRYSQSCS